jgi:hypothetical protein
MMSIDIMSKDPAEENYGFSGEKILQNIVSMLKVFVRNSQDWELYILSELN